MKYPLDNNHKEETPVTFFIPGEWYRCINSKSSFFKENKIYLCVKLFKTNASFTYLVYEGGLLQTTTNLQSKFVLEE